MDISCEMELPFSEPNSLTGASFEHTASGIPVKLLGNSEDDDNLLSGNSDKHLSASDFKLDLGPANDLVSDFGISSDSLMIPDEPSEGYSISDAALEGGVRPTETNVVTVDNYLQSIPLMSTISGLQTVQVIPFGYLISGSKPESGQHLPVTSVPNGVDISQTSQTCIQTVHNAVVIGNLMVLKNLQGKEASNDIEGDTLVQTNSESILLSNVDSETAKSKVLQVTNSSDVSRRVAQKRNMVQSRLQHQNGSLKNVSSSQKNTKVKIDGKTISLTFEVKDVHACDMKKWQNVTKNLTDDRNTPTKSSTTAGESSRKKQTMAVSKTTPEMRIVTNMNEASDGTKYVSLLNGRNNSITLKKEDVDLNDNSEQSRKNIVENSKELIKTSDKTREMEEEVITLLANASEERSRIEQERSKGTPGRKKSGKPCGNLPNNDTLFKCDVCGLEFNRHGNFTRHKLIHDVRFKDRYKCLECDRTFLQRCDLKRHMLIHSNQEPYRCPECDKGYIRRSDLVVHMRFHKKERIFSCPYCLDRKFCQSGDLNRHVRTIHLRSATYKCSECEKQFSKEPALIQHQFMCHGVIQNSKKKIKSTNSSLKMKTSSKKKQVLQ